MTRILVLRLPRLVAQGRSSAIFGALLIGLLWFGIAVKFLSDTDVGVRELHRRNESISLMSEENIRRTIGEIDKTLLYLRQTAPNWVEANDYGAVVQTADLLSDLVVRVAIIDAKGTLRASSLGPQPTQPMDLSDREYFRAHLGIAEDRLFISKAVIGRVSKAWCIQFTRRFLNKDGSFGGVVVVSLKPDSLTGFFNNVDFAAPFSITLIGDDGIVRSSGGTAAGFGLGQDLHEAKLFREGRRPGSVVTVDDDTSIPGERRVVTVREVRGQPLWLSIGTDLDAAFHDANASLRRNAIAGLTMTLVMLLVLESRLRLEAKARQKTEQLHLTLENINQGIVMVTKDLKIPIINSRCAELLGLHADAIENPAWLDALLPHRRRAPAAASPQDAGPPSQASLALPGPVEEHELADGTLLEIRSIPLPDGGLVQTFTDITTRRANEAHAERLASEDPLTGLLNRRVFRAALEDDAHADAAHAPAKVAPASTHKDGASVRIAVMFLDLDRFKVINDALGHRTGDLLLKEVAERLRAAIGPDDVLARLGGDEFAVAMREPGSRTKIAARAQRLLDAITPPFEIEGYHVRTGASIGIALGPFDGHDADDLMKAADLALYAMKSESRGGFKFYNPAMSAQLCERREIETDLRAAIERGDLQLHYQPIINLQENCISGFEALARWRHTTKGMIPPAQFIPIAEDSGLIMAIGKWALEEACRQASCWPGDTKIAVNLSPIQLLIPDLPERIAGLLKETGLAPHRLEIEITEQTVLSDDENTIATLHRLKDLGVRIAMDDFGTGYSSLSYLRTFPFDKIKIDRGFVSDLGRGPEHAIIVQAVISIAHALGMTTTAEGVEADRQREFLTALGCEEAQGYLFSHAITGDEVDAMLSTWGYRAMRAA